MNTVRSPMDSPRTLLRCVLVIALSWPAAAAFAGFWDFFKRDIEVITVTDATPMGALLRAPSPADPVYYTAINVGYHDFGGIIAGEKIPPKEQVVKTITTVLAKQGYIPATAAHPPTLLLLWAWGTMNTDRFYSGSLDNTEGVQVNRSQMLRFLGGYKLGLVSKTPDPLPMSFFPAGVSVLDADADAIFQTASDDLYVAAIAAYDFKAAQRKEKVLLWTTKISCPSRGLILPEALPVMLTIAGPNIGRETARPVWARASERFKPDIKIGDPALVEYLDSKQLPIIDAPQNAGKRSGAAKPKKKP